MRNGPFKNIVDATRDWVNEKERQYLPGEIYDPVPNQIIEMLWNSDITMDDLVPVTGAEGLEPVTERDNFQHFLDIFYPDFPTDFVPNHTLKFTNTGHDTLTIYAPNYNDKYVDHSFYYKSQDGWVEWNDDEGFVVEPGQTVETCGFLHVWSFSYQTYSVSIDRDSNLKVSGYLDALIDTGISHGSAPMQNGMFYRFFYNCQQLTDASELILPTKLTGQCFNQMFGECTNLKIAPTLPATVLAPNCYSGMFENCHSLTTAPTLPATVLAPGCYGGMFSGCSNLVHAPVLPATVLVDSCYFHMFGGCTSLVESPALPTTTLVNGCYSYMFESCTSLTKAPDLLATVLAPNCYGGMFDGCEKLNYIKCMAVPGTNEYSTGDWLYGVSETGTFVKADEADWEEDVSGVPVGWNVQDGGSVATTIQGTLRLRQLGSLRIDTDEEYAEDGYLIYVNISKHQTLYFSTDNTHWQLYKYGDVYKIPAGQTIYVCGRLSDHNDDVNNTHFNITGEDHITITGNINSLWDYSDLNKPLYEYCGYNLFSHCNALREIRDLVIPTADVYCCYYYTFPYCMFITEPCQLPATKLAAECYSYMFNNCTSLTTVPELPATKLTNYCYAGMFDNCSRLVSIPELPATELAYGCYNSMFVHCSRLTTSQSQPVILPATLLYSSCYNNMFSYCPNVRHIKCLAINPTSSNCGHWLRNSSSSGEFTKAAGVEWERSYSGIPENWTVEEETIVIPEVPSTGMVLNQKGSICFEQLDGEDFLLGFFTKQEQELFISTDNIHWTKYDGRVYRVHNKVYVCGYLASQTSEPVRLYLDGENIKVSSQLVSIWNYYDLKQPLYQECGQSMFEQCTALVDISELVFPATTSINCYGSMFYRCTNLVSVPVLPATELTSNCYSLMFGHCSSLETVPYDMLPATVLAPGCYNSMFSGCYNLKTTPELPATELSDYCYGNMFLNCTSLTDAPILPAPRLVDECYSCMFEGCYNLSHVNCQATYLSPVDQYNWSTSEWLRGVSATGTFICSSIMEPDSMNWQLNSSDGIPTGWTVINNE